MNEDQEKEQIHRNLRGIISELDKHMGNATSKESRLRARMIREMLNIAVDEEAGPEQMRQAAVQVIVFIQWMIGESELEQFLERTASDAN